MPLEFGFSKCAWTSSSPLASGGSSEPLIEMASDAALTATLVINNGQVTGNGADGGAGGILNVSFDPAGTSSVTLHHTNVSSNTSENCEPPGSVSGCTG